MRILTVIPLQKNSFKEELTYFSSQDIALGAIVEATLKNKKILGLVVSSILASDMKSEIKDMNFNLKKIVEVKDKSIFRAEFIEACLQTSKYFVANKNHLVSYMIPSVVKEKYDIFSKIDYKKEEIKNESNKTVSEKLLFQAGSVDRISYYKTLIRSSFANNKSIFIVLPTENDIGEFESELKKGIENFTVIIHSGLNTKKTQEAIEQILKEEHPILILGTAPYLSVPRHDLDIIVLEKESSSSYKTIAPPRFDIRTFVEIFASKINAKLIMGDTLLRFETIARKELDNLSEVRPISFRVNFEGEIQILEKNKKNFLGEEKFKVISDDSIELITKKLLKKKNIFVFSLRKGLATFTICKNCGTEVYCDTCMSPVVLYKSQDGQKRMFVCNKCKESKDPDMVCGHCGSWDLTPLGIGTDTVYEELQQKIVTQDESLQKVKIFKLDKESAKNAGDAKKIIKEFEENPGSILVGTEMALFYLRKNVELSVIASFDSLWSIPNYKISEKIIQIIFKILEKTDSKLIIETKNTEDNSITSVKNGNIISFVREELDDRKKLGYPPYKRFIKISYLGDKEETTKTRHALAEVFKEYNPSIFGGFVAQSKGKFTTNALIKLETNDWSLPEISISGKINEDLFTKLSSLPRTFSVQIDPEDLL